MAARRRPAPHDEVRVDGRDRATGYFDGIGDSRWFAAEGFLHGGATARVWVYQGDQARVRVGKYASIGDDVEFLPGGNHRIDWVTNWPMREVWDLADAYEGNPWSRGDIVVGNDVWIGRGARILSGVSIGDGAVIGAYAVVARDVRPFAVVAGNPAEERRRRFDDETVAALLRIKWWDWPEAVVRERVPSLCGGDVGDFVRAFDNFG